MGLLRARTTIVYGALSYYGHLLARETVGAYWRRVEENGKDPNPYRLAFVQFIGVGDTDAEAYKLYREPAEYFFNRSLHVYAGFADPPGYVTEASVRARYKSAVAPDRPNQAAKHDLTWDEMVEKGYVVIGSPDTVRETLEEVAKTFNCGHLLTVLHFGNMSDELTRYNTQAVRRQGRARRCGVCSPMRSTTGGRRTRPRSDGRLARPHLPVRHRRPPCTVAGARDARRRRLERRRARRSAASTAVPGFVAPDDHLGWLTVFWDAIDQCGATLPCPVVGASVGGMLAADLAALRPEVGDGRSRCSRPFGIFDEANPGLDLYAVPDTRTDGAPLRQGRARAVRRALRRARARGRAGGPLPQRRRRGRACCGRSATGVTASRIHRIALPDARRSGASRTSCCPWRRRQRWAERRGAGRGRRRRRPSARMGRARRGCAPASWSSVARLPGRRRPRRRHRLTGVRWVSSTRRSSTSSTSSRTPTCRPTTGDDESLWVDFPNSNYDPKIGHELYNRYLSEMVLADKLGYDGLVLNEHHNTQYSMNPAPNLTAAALIPQTKGWISVFGTPPNLGYPNRLAEEYAMLDVMSGGRLRVAFPLGTGMEYWANAVNPATARARFRESIDIILRCWTRGRPAELRRRLLHVPLPQPVAQADAEAAPRVLHRRHRLARDDRAGRRARLRLLGRVHPDRRCSCRCSTTTASVSPTTATRPTPDKVTIGVMAYVAETDAKAEEEFMPHVMYFFENALRTTPRYLNPPGYVTVPEFRKRIQAADVHGSAELGRPRRRSTASSPARPRRSPTPSATWIEEAGQQPREPQPHARRHAQLEGREEHHAVRRRGHPAPARTQQGGAGSERR